MQNSTEEKSNLAKAQEHLDQEKVEKAKSLKKIRDLEA
jgi:hypothetical protein